MSNQNPDDNSMVSRRKLISCAGAAGLTLAIPSVAAAGDDKKGNGEKQQEKRKKAAAVGYAAPDNIEVRDRAGVMGTKSECDTQSFHDGSAMLESMLTGSFSSGVKAEYNGSGETYGYVDGVDTDYTVSFESTFEIGGVSASISLGNGSFGFVSDTKVKYENEFEYDGEGATPSHTYSNLTATSWTALYSATQKDSMTVNKGDDAYTLYTHLEQS